MAEFYNLNYLGDNNAFISVSGTKGGIDVDNIVIINNLTRASSHLSVSVRVTLVSINYHFDHI